MWTIAVICMTIMVTAQAGYSSSGSGYAGAGAAAGSHAGHNGYGSSYSSNYPYPGQNGFAGSFPQPFPPFPPQPFLNPGEFNQALNSYLASLQQNHAASASMTFSTPEASAYASSSLYPDNLYQQQLAHQQAIFNSIKQQQAQAQAAYSHHGGAGGNGGGAYSGSYGGRPGGGGYAPNYASSSASYGPGGIHQTAHISPANPNSPNVDTRFGADESIHGHGGPGFFGVSTSSFSESADVNGQQTNRRGASTTVNDNGKITSYQTHS